MPIDFCIVLIRLLNESKFIQFSNLIVCMLLLGVANFLFQHSMGSVYFKKIDPYP